MRRLVPLLVCLAVLGWSTPAAESITGTQTAAFILVTFDGSQPWTVAQAQVTVNQLATYYQTSSSGQYQLTGTVYGYVQMAPTCDLLAIATAAKAGITADHYLYALTANTCGWPAGMTAGQDSWLNNTILPQTVEHEFGHQLGLGHAHGPNGEYGDPWTVMGYGTTTLTGYERAQLGWLVPTPASYGTWTILPLDGTGQRVLTYADLILDYRPENFGVTIRQISGGATTVIPAGGTGCTCYYPLNLGQSWQAADGTWFTVTARNSVSATVVIGSSPATTTTSTTTTTTSTTLPPTTTTTRCRKKHC